MKKISLFLVVLFCTTILYAQEHYYYYDGNKRYLEINTQYAFLMQKENKVLNFNSINVKYSSLKSIDLSRYSQNTIKKDLRYWTELSFEDKMSETDYLTKLSEMKSICKECVFAPYFIDKDRNKVGLSNYFYVKLYSLNDTVILRKEAEKYNALIIHQNKFMPLWFTLSVSELSKLNALDLANTLYESKKFKYSEPDFIIDNPFASCPSDPSFNQQWGLRNTGQNGGTAGIDIKACDAWDISKGQNIVVAVVDMGVELNHPDLSANIYPLSYDAGSGTSPSTIYGDHGTQCAGVVGAVQNTSGGSGVAPNCKVMSISVTASMNTPNVIEKFADGINWAYQHSADVISNSWGDNNLISDLITNAIDSAVTNGRNHLGCVVIVASHNDGSSLRYPATLPNVIAVGSIDNHGTRASDSNYGTGLDVVAPGVNIYTTTLAYDGYYTTVSGTSFAAPHVAGLAALILSVRPDLTQEQVRYAIESTCTKLSGYSFSNNSNQPNGTWNDEVGYGLINASWAVNSVAPVVSGPSLVCPSSFGSFTVDHFPAGDTITWLCETGVLERISDQGSNPCNFIATGSGNGWVQAVIKNGDYEYTTPQAFCSAGIPTIMYLDGPTPVQTSYNYYYCAEKDVWNLNAQYYWSLSQDGIYTSPTNQNGTNIIFVTPDHYTLLEVAACNSCGCSDNYYLEIDVYGNYRLMLSPNPSTAETIVSIGSTSGESLDANLEWNFEVYDQGFQLKARQTKIIGKEFKLKTSGWKEGIYIVRANYKGKFLTEKLVVKR